jgi:hypothetical protein
VRALLLAFVSVGQGALGGAKQARPRRCKMGRVTYTIVDAASIEPTPGPHPAASLYDKGVGEALGVSAFEIYQVELPPARRR